MAPRRRLALLACSLLGLSGCGSGPITDETPSTESDGDPGDGDGDGDSGDGDGDPGDGDGDPGDGDGDPIPLECPPPEPVTVFFEVTPASPRAGTCAVVDESFDGVDAYSMTLDCAGELVSVSLESTILRMPNPGPMIEIDYRAEAVGVGEDRWLAIHQVVDQQALVLGAVAASRLDPPGTTLAAFFRDPALSIAAEQPCELTTDSCGELQRLALAVSTELFGPASPVFDHGSWYADFLAFGYVIEVEQAIRRVRPRSCEDAPAESAARTRREDQWFSLLVVWFPSD